MGPDELSNSVRGTHSLSNHLAAVADIILLVANSLELRSSRIQRRQQQRVRTGSSSHAKIRPHNFLANWKLSYTGSSKNKKGYCYIHYQRHLRKGFQFSAHVIVEAKSACAMTSQQLLAEQHLL